MARPGRASGSKRTSFGKRTEAEKSFRTKKKARPGAREDGPSGGSRFSKPAKFSSSRFDSGESRGKKEAPFGRKSDAGKSFGSKRPTSGFRRDDKNESGEKRFSKPGGSRFGAGKPFNSDRPKPFVRKREGDRESPSNEKRFSKSGGSRFGAAKSFNSDRPKPFIRKDDDRDSSAGEKRFPGRDDKKTFSPRPERPRSSDEKGKYSKSFEKRKPGDDRFSKFKKEDSEKSLDKKPDYSKFERPERREGGFKKSFTSKKSFARAESGSVPEVKKEQKQEDGLIRLNKFMANSGVGSRREADELIKMGLVTVNGETITEMGHKVKATDDVRYEGRKLKAEPLVYILLNKPKGFITTTDDPEERNTVMDLVANACKERIYPVGRLDRNTTGLLLFTNDGDLADKLTHPSYNAKKIYKVELDRALTKNDFQKILDGVYLEEGRAQVDDLAVVSDNDKEVGIEIHIGWNRIVRRIFETLGYQIVRLDRVVYAGLDKKDLGRGQWRFLKPEEIIQLKHFKI